jgi:hypothetical protein
VPKIQRIFLQRKGLNILHFSCCFQRQKNVEKLGVGLADMPIRPFYGTMAMLKEEICPVSKVIQNTVFLFINLKSSTLTFCM